MAAIKMIRGHKDENSFYVESNYGVLLFDTGASSSQLTRFNLTDSLQKVQTEESHGVLGSKIQDVVVVEELRVGDIKANNLAVTLDDSAGLLGNDVLKNYSYTFDTYKNEITLINPFTSDIKCTTGQRGHLYVETKFGHKKCMALIDTGASCSIIDELFYKEIFGTIPNIKGEKGEDWTGATFDVQNVPIDSLTIGNVNFPQHEFAILDFRKVFPYMEYPIAAIIGASTLSCRRFSFNQTDGYLIIED